MNKSELTRMDYKLQHRETYQKTAVVMILTEPELMNGERFQLRVKFSFDRTKMIGAELSKLVGEPGRTEPAELDPIDFKLAIGSFTQEDKQLLRRPGFRTYEDLDDPERRFVIEVRSAVKYIAEQGKEFMAGVNSQKAARVNRPVSKSQSEPTLADPLAAIDSVLGEADALRRSITNPAPPTHR